MTSKTIKYKGKQKYVLMGRSFTEKGARTKVANIKKHITPKVIKEKVGKRYKVWLGVDY